MSDVHLLPLFVVDGNVFDIFCVRDTLSVVDSSVVLPGFSPKMPGQDEHEYSPSRFTLAPLPPALKPDAKPSQSRLTALRNARVVNDTRWIWGGE